MPRDIASRGRLIRTLEARISRKNKRIKRDREELLRLRKFYTDSVTLIGTYSKEMAGLHLQVQHQKAAVRLLLAANLKWDLPVGDITEKTEAMMARLHVQNERIRELEVRLEDALSEAARYDRTIRTLTLALRDM